MTLRPTDGVYPLYGPNFPKALGLGLRLKSEILLGFCLMPAGLQCCIVQP